MDTLLHAQRSLIRPNVPFSNAVAHLVEDRLSYPRACTKRDAVWVHDLSLRLA